MTRRAVTAVSGLLLIVAGLGVGLWPRATGSVSCGSPLQPSGAPYVSDLLGETHGAVAACSGALSLGPLSLHLLAVSLLVTGAALAIRALFSKRQPTTP